jgi:hypothetical protein
LLICSSNSEWRAFAILDSRISNYPSLFCFSLKDGESFWSIEQDWFHREETDAVTCSRHINTTPGERKPTPLPQIGAVVTTVVLH